MTDNDHPPPPPPVTQQRSGCLVAFMIVAGIILLLPGLCALIFGGLALSEGSIPSDIASLILLGLFVGAGGVMLIVSAIRGRRP
jgi:uncharacterized membrane protein HdeD (DUF308 family)